jgi:transposase
VLLSQDEARFPMVPTLRATLGVKGHRPVVGTRDNKDLLYVFGVINLTSAALHANTLESPKDAKKKTGKSKTRRMQEAFAAHLRHVGKIYPTEKHKEVVLLIDNAPWHRGGPIDEALAENPHLKFKRLPAYSPQLNPIERFWKVLRRRATHNRLFEALGDLKWSLRASLSYFQTVRDRVKTLLLSRRKQQKANQTASASVFHGSASLRSGTPSAFDRILRPRSVQSKRMRQESAHASPVSASIPNGSRSLQQLIALTVGPSRLNERAGGACRRGGGGASQSGHSQRRLQTAGQPEGLEGVPLVFGALRGARRRVQGPPRLVESWRADHG